MEVGELLRADERSVNGEGLVLKEGHSSAAPVLLIQSPVIVELQCN